MPIALFLDMLAAALIPLVFILGDLLVFFLLGTWPVGALTSRMNGAEPSK